MSSSVRDFNKELMDHPGYTACVQAVMDLHGYRGYYRYWESNARGMNRDPRLSTQRWINVCIVSGKYTDEGGKRKVIQTIWRQRELRLAVDESPSLELALKKLSLLQKSAASALRYLQLSDEVDSNPLMFRYVSSRDDYKVTGACVSSATTSNITQEGLRKYKATAACVSYATTSSITQEDLHKYSSIAPSALVIPGSMQDLLSRHAELRKNLSKANRVCNGDCLLRADACTCVLTTLRGIQCVGYPYIVSEVWVDEAAYTVVSVCGSYTKVKYHSIDDKGPMRIVKMIQSYDQKHGIFSVQKGGVDGRTDRIHNLESQTVKVWQSLVIEASSEVLTPLIRASFPLQRLDLVETEPASPSSDAEETTLVSSSPGAMKRRVSPSLSGASKRGCV